MQIAAAIRDALDCETARLPKEFVSPARTTGAIFSQKASHVVRRADLDAALTALVLLLRN